MRDVFACDEGEGGAKRQACGRTSKAYTERYMASGVSTLSSIREVFLGSPLPVVLCSHVFFETNNIVNFRTWI